MSDSTATSSSPVSAPSPAALINNLHHLVTVKLNRDNYVLWKAQIFPYLRGQKVFGYVDGSIPPPPQTIPAPTSTSIAPITVPNPEFLLWVQ